MSYAIHRRKRARQGEHSMSFITPPITSPLVMDFASLTLQKHSNEIKELREQINTIRELLISIEGSVKRIETFLGTTQEKNKPIPEECFYYA